MLSRDEDLSDAAQVFPCLVYVHSSLCSAAEAGGRCEALELGVALETLSSSSFSVEASSDRRRYATTSVPTRLALVRGARQAAP